MKIVPDEAFIDRNYEKICELDIDNGKPLVNILEAVEERLMICPASSRKDFYSCFPGGLTYHNLCTFFWLKKFTGIMSPKKYNETTLFKLAVLHDIGKIGDKEHEYYLPQDSQWHRERGMYYTINPDIQYMKIPQRSLWWAQECNVSLTQEEYLAILLQDEKNSDVDAAYKYKEPTLAMILQYAANWSRKKEKEDVVNWP